MGGLVGAALVYANYFHAIDIVEGGRGVRTLTTASLFSTYAVRAFLDMTDPSAFLVLTDILVELHDERVLFLLGIPRYRSASGTCLRYDGQEEHVPSTRSCSPVLVYSHSRYWSSPRHGNW